MGTTASNAHERHHAVGMPRAEVLARRAEREANPTQEEIDRVAQALMRAHIEGRSFVGLARAAIRALRRQ